MLKSKMLAASIKEDYLEEHPIKTEEVYEKMYEDHHQWQPIMKLLKLSMLINLITANMERGFSMLTLLHTKQRNGLTPSSLDQLMQIMLLGPQRLDNKS